MSAPHRVLPAVLPQPAQIPLTSQFVRSAALTLWRALTLLATLAALPALVRAQSDWSPDPQNLTRENLWGIGSAQRVLIAVGERGTILRYDYDDPPWQLRSVETTAWLLGVASGANRWVIVGDAGTIFVSDDQGDTWLLRTAPTTARLNAVAYGNNRWLAIGEQGTVLTSTDANTWETRPALGRSFLRALAFGQGRFLLGGAGGALYTTTDASTFTRITLATTADIEAAAISPNRFFVAGSGGLLGTATQLDSWTLETPSRGGTFRGLVARGDNDASAVGDAKAYRYNLSWAENPLDPKFLATSAAIGTDEAVAVGFGGGIARSSSLYTLTILPGRTVNVLYGADIRLTVTTTGPATNVTYQWHRDDVPLPGATSTELMLRAARPEDSAHYTIRGTSGPTSMLSSTTHLNVVPLGRPEVVDPSFTYGLDTPPNRVIPHSDGTLYINFGFLAPSRTYRRSVTRLTSSGKIDPTFSPAVDGQPEVSFEVVRVLPDGRLYISGSFVSIGGVPNRGFARLLPDGSLDRSFTLDPSLATHFDPTPLADGRVILSTGGDSVRLLATGRLDSTYRVTSPFNIVGVNSAGQSIATVGWSYQSSRNFTYTYGRSLDNGTRDPAFNVTIQNPAYTRLIGDWLSSEAWEHGKIFSFRYFTSINTVTGASGWRLGAPNPYFSINTVSWFQRPDGAVWELSNEGGGDPKLLYPAYGSRLLLYHPKTGLQPDHYASRIDRTDYHPIASGSAGELYARPNLYIAGNAPSPHLIRIRPISGRIGRLTNLSVRADVSSTTPLIAGFVTTGTGATRALVRGIGPSLDNFGVTDALRNPALSLTKDGAVAATNDDWAPALADRFTAVGAFPLLAGTRDAALEAEIGAGNYTAVLNASGTDRGTGLIELFESSVTATAPRRFINVSARGPVTPNQPLIVGFTITGEVPISVLIRGTGPTLTRFGVGDVLPDPRLMLFRRDTVLWENDNWTRYNKGPYFRSDDSDPFMIATKAVSAFALPDGSRDAAMLLTLAPGSYTAQVSGAGSTSGTALIEVYEVP